jgi:hypothetical protein
VFESGTEEVNGVPPFKTSYDIYIRNFPRNFLSRLDSEAPLPNQGSNFHGFLSEGSKWAQTALFQAKIVSDQIICTFLNLDVIRYNIFIYLGHYFFCLSCRQSCSTREGHFQGGCRVHWNRRGRWASNTGSELSCQGTVGDTECRMAHRSDSFWRSCW